MNDGDNNGGNNGGNGGEDDGKTSGLTLLGAGHADYSDKYDPDILESFENRFPDQDYIVELQCPEFTSLCPMTGQPDFGRITIIYEPDKRLVESKSLKIYLFSYRNFGEFHEDCVNRIARDLKRLLEPRWLVVKGRFNPRGGISINPACRIGHPPPGVWPPCERHGDARPR
jgi:7-cyano-7-deazaguanine reductase